MSPGKPPTDGRRPRQYAFPGLVRNPHFERDRFLRGADDPDVRDQPVTEKDRLDEGDVELAAAKKIHPEAIGDQLRQNREAVLPRSDRRREPGPFRCLLIVVDVRRPVPSRRFDRAQVCLGGGRVQQIWRRGVLGTGVEVVAIGFAHDIPPSRSSTDVMVWRVRSLSLSASRASYSSSK